MDQLMRHLDVAWRLGVLTYALNLSEMLLNGLTSVCGLRDRLVAPIDPATAQGHGRLCIITGSNAGIGKYTAAELHKRGWKVIMACRSVERGHAAAKEIAGSHTANGHSVPLPEVQELDLNSLESVRSFSSRITSQHEQPSLVICNAGVMAPAQRVTTVDGMEGQFQGNYLGHWLMVRTLMEAQLRGLPHSRPPHELRVVFLSSCTHTGARQVNTVDCPRLSQVLLSPEEVMLPRLDFQDLNMQRRRYSGLQGYVNSKLCMILAAREFQRRFDRLGQSARGLNAFFCSVHPGLIETGMSRTWLKGPALPAVVNGWLQSFWDATLPHMLMTPEQAVHTMLYAACAPANQVAGRYVGAHSKVVQPSRMARNDALAARLWDVSMQLTHQKPGLL